MSKNTAQTPATNQDVKPEKAYVRSNYGDFIHPYTNDRITGDGKRVEIDNWVQVQIDCGKLEIVPA